MSKFIVQQSVILNDYESYRSLSFQFYERGVVIESRQDEVNNKERGADPRHFSYLIVSRLKNDEAIKLRDRLLARYPIEQRQAVYQQGVQAERERLYNLSANEFLAEKLSGHIEQTDE